MGKDMALQALTEELNQMRDSPKKDKKKKKDKH